MPMRLPPSALGSSAKAIRQCSFTSSHSIKQSASSHNFTPSFRPTTTSPHQARQSRPFTHSSRVLFPRKDSQDRNSIDTEATEYSKSGTDDGAARQDNAAFNPDVTDPAAEKDIAGEGNKESGNPLDVSPANQEVSKPPKGTGATAEEGGENKKSGHGSPSKAGNR